MTASKFVALSALIVFWLPAPAGWPPGTIRVIAVILLPIGRFIRLLVPFAIFGWLVMVPLQYGWWRYLGYIP